MRPLSMVYTTLDALNARPFGAIADKEATMGWLLAVGLTLVAAYALIGRMTVKRGIRRGLYPDVIDGRLDFWKEALVWPLALLD